MLATIEYSLRPGMEREFEAALDKAHRCLEKHDGFLGEEACRSLLDEGKFVTIFYFRDRDSMQAWRNDADHIRLQELGKERIFAWYRIRIAELEREYSFNEEQGSGLRTH